MSRDRRGGKVNAPIPIRSWSGGGSASSGAAIPVYAQTKSTSMPADPESNPTPDGAPTISEQRGELVGFEDKSNWLARMGRALRGEASMADQLNSQLALGTRASEEARALQGDRLRAELENLREQKAHAERLQAALLEGQGRNSLAGIKATADANIKLEELRSFNTRTGNSQMAGIAEQKALLDSKLKSGEALTDAEIKWYVANKANPADPTQRGLANVGSTARLTDSNSIEAADRADKDMVRMNYLSRLGDAGAGYAKFNKSMQIPVGEKDAVFVQGVNGVSGLPNYLYTGQTTRPGAGPLDPVETVPPRVSVSDPSAALAALRAANQPAPVGSTAMSADSDVPPVDQRFSVVEPAKPQVNSVLSNAAATTADLIKWLYRKTQPVRNVFSPENVPFGGGY